MPSSTLHQPILQWYDAHARDLPWRRTRDPWAVLVSEVMLQQTPVARVLVPYEAWMDRWPTPGALADEPVGEAIRMWGRLGYPRRAMRLHAAASDIDARLGGRMPTTYEGLRELPGIGDYTAAAVMAFAYRERALVLDTNVRRVLGRVLGGVEYPASHVVAAERQQAAGVLPDDPETAATWSVAVMELGALVCTARSPGCDACPVADACAWRAAGYPAYDGPPRKGQAWTGTDRQCRGRMMALLRESDGPIEVEHVLATWDDAAQRERCLESLVADGLVVREGQALRLP